MWLRKLKHKTVAEVSAELVKLFRTNKPNIVVSDNGTEFALKNFLQNYGVKQVFQPSYVPQSQVENWNGQIRKLLSIEFVRRNNLKWIDRLDFIENNLNHFNLEIRKAKTVVQAPLKVSLRIGDLVRVSFSVFDSKFRQNKKTGDQKYSHIKFTPSVFTIYKIYKSKTENGLKSYALLDDNQNLILNDDGKIERVKQNDLQYIPQEVNEDVDMDNLDVNKLNNHNGPQNI